MADGPNLDAANRQRRHAHHVRARLIVGEITVEQALRDPAVHGITVARVIGWVPGWGPRRADRLLTGLRPFPISPNRLCGELTLRQCRLLGERVR